VPQQSTQPAISSSATVVVIMRHPVHVVASHLDQPWAPSTLDGMLNWLQPVYQRWLAQRTALLADRRYAEMKAEDLAAHWPDTRRRRVPPGCDVA
jgi:hypothetical protein